MPRILGETTSSVLAKFPNVGKPSIDEARTNEVNFHPSVNRGKYIRRKNIVHKRLMTLLLLLFILLLLLLLLPLLLPPLIVIVIEHLYSATQRFRGAPDPGL